MMCPVFVCSYRKDHPAEVNKTLHFESECMAIVSVNMSWERDGFLPRIDVTGAE